ncbi:MAG: Dyp-type peroxidase [Oceanobacter sp.]
MATPQIGIFTQGSTQYYYLEYQIDWSKPLADIRAALKAAVQQNLPTNLVVAFGQQAWSQLVAEQPDSISMPEGLCDFAPIESRDGYVLPSTQSDLFFWIHSGRTDDNFDRVQSIATAMEGFAELVLDLPGFCYHDSRDLSGFVDGSANPKTDSTRLEAALIPEGKPGAGGAFVLGQKWIHNLKAFHQMPVKEQEGVIGRTKPDSIELEGDDMPENSHVSRTDAKVDGVAMKMWRRSAPFASASEKGLFFLAFACELRRYEVLLERMYGLAEDGVRDRLIEFSTPVRSSYWFAPSLEDLETVLN